MAFVRAPNPVWFMVDLEGLPLNDEYWAIFLTNTLPYIPQAPTHDPEGLIPWTGGKVRFQPGGTLPNELYFDPDLVYRIEIRHGPNQTDPLIYEINNFVPCCGSNDTQQNDLLSGTNQITNPQFQDISFASPFTYTQSVSGDYTIQVAPGWFLDLTGAGTTILTQLELSGTDDIPGNPPYALRLNNSGWSTAILRQRFEQNGAIFASGAIAMDVTVRALDTTKDLIFTYSPSFPGTPIEIFSGTAQVGVFSVLKGAINLPASSNNTTGNDAYVDIEIEIEPSGTLDITNIQILGQSVPLPDDFVEDDTPLFKEQTIERQLDQQFHYYANSLIKQPKQSLLAGWNFSLNPFQFNATALTNVSTQTEYIADQTIIYQETAANLQSGKATDDDLKGGLEIIPITSATNTRFALIQYIDPSIVLPYWSDVLSSLATVKYLSETPTTQRIKMRLIYRTDLPPTISPTEPIASWTVDDDPVFAAGWTALEPINDPAYELVNGEYVSMSFDGFQLPDNASSTMTLGIVIYAMDRMNSTNTPHDRMIFDKISLVPNDFAIETQSETYDESLRKCQFYYEKSFPKGDVPGSVATGNGALLYAQRMSNDEDLLLASFGIPFQQVKRANPVIDLYAPLSGTIGEVDVIIYINGSQAAPGPAQINADQWSLAAQSEAYAEFLCQDTTSVRITAAPSVGNEAVLWLHYVADARLGI